MTHSDVATLDLQEAIHELLSQRFQEVKILSVSIVDQSFCEEGVIEINVLFEGTRDDLVKGHPPGIFGLVRDRVANFCRHGAPSPVFNFISSDAHA